MRTKKTNEHMQRLNQLYDGYPVKAPFIPEEEEQLQWYYNEKEKWGSWILNICSRPMTVPVNLEKATMYPVSHSNNQAERLVYRSPIPLHQAEVPNSFRAHMTWYIDENGWGQYVYYTRVKDDKSGKFKGRILFITRYV